MEEVQGNVAWAGLGLCPVSGPGLQEARARRPALRVRGPGPRACGPVLTARGMYLAEHRAFGGWE